MIFTSVGSCFCLVGLTSLSASAASESTYDKAASAPLDRSVGLAHLGLLIGSDCVS